MTRFLGFAKSGKTASAATFRSYLKTRLMASVFLMVAIIGGSLYYCLNQAFEAQFLARARAEKNLAEEVLKDRIQNIDKRLREVANNNTVKITLMLGVKPQLKELLQEVCPPNDGAHYFVHGGPDQEFYPDKPQKLIQLIQSAGPHNFEAKPFFIPDRLTLIFAKPLKRNEEIIGTAYCVYNLSQDASLEIQLHQIGNNWFYFQTPHGLKRLDNFLREETPASHPVLTNHDDFQPYLWGTIAGVTAPSYLFESLCYFVPTRPLTDLQNHMYYVIGVVSLLLAVLIHPFATLLTNRLSAPLQEMAAEARAISQGDNSRGFDPAGKAFIEFQQLTQTFNAMLQQLHQAQEDSRFRELFDHVSDVVWIQDLAGNILETNEFGYKVLGYSREELLALKVEDISFPEDRAKVRRTLEEQGEAVFRGYRRNRQGLKIPFEVKAKTIVYKDAPGILTVARDITIIRKAEEVVRQQNLVLEEMVAQRTAELSAAMAAVENARQTAESANLAKSQFLANMSHEIRTPINGMLGAIELLLNTEVTGQQRRFLENASDSGKILLTLINDILDISRIEASQLVLEDIPFHLSKLVGEVVELSAREAQAKGLAIECRIAPTTPCRLKGDPVRLSQILLNLLGNAVKFTPTGMIAVRVTCIQEDGESAEIKVEVQDTGIGISPEVQSLIFEPFRQGDGSTTRKFGGSGLGLAIIKHLVLLMGGNIGVDSQPTKGSTFWFSIPFAKDPQVDTDLPAPKDGHAARFPTPAQGKRIVDSSARILLAEDNLVNQEVASAMLTHIGCLVDVVSDGLQALDALSRNRYDLVFMDCQMPELDGYEATRTIRAEEAQATPTSRLPIIALTAHAMAGDRELCLAAGMDDYLSKPFNLEQLRAILDKWLLPGEMA
jgi:two-component system, sensor histidine kinase